MENYQVTLIESFDHWQKISKSWNELLGESASDNIFLTWEWLSAWTECFLNKDRRLFVLTVCKNDELLGIAPWYVSRRSHLGFPLKQIEFLGSPESGSDYLDVFMKKGKEREVAFCIHDFLLDKARPLWDCLMLQDMPTNSRFLLHFLEKLREEGKYAEIRYGSFCPIALLPRENEEFFSQVSSHRRKRYNREVRIIRENGAIEHQHFFVDEKVNGHLKEFFAFLSETKQGDNEDLCVFIERVVRRCGEKSPVQMDVLRSDGKMVAGLLHLIHGSSHSLYMMATDKTFNPKISLGNVLVGLSIERAIKQGMVKYDFLKGGEEYKFYWANEGRSSCSFVFWQRKAIPIMIAGVTFMKYLGKLLLR
jgi:CelD/BcsL family acetyltransferase involved in cellulose biosynthesis